MEVLMVNIRGLLRDGYKLDDWPIALFHFKACDGCFFLAKPARTQDHCKAEKNCQDSPGDAIQCGFCTAGAAEHGATTRGKPSHAGFGAVKQNQNDQQNTTADPGPGQN